MSVNDETTRVPCPACETCQACRGRGEILCVCIICDTAHEIPCTGCKVCGLCQGTHLVLQNMRKLWIHSQKSDPPPEAA